MLKCSRCLCALCMQGCCIHCSERSSQTRRSRDSVSTGIIPRQGWGRFPVRFRREFNKYLLSSPYIVPGPVVGTGDRR